MDNEPQVNCPIRSLKGQNLDLPGYSKGLRRIVEISFWMFLILLVFRIWMFGYYPSQDGPSHLYNAGVVVNYNATPIFQEFYSVRLSPAGNVLAQVLECGLLKIVGERAAERLLLTLYVILLPLSFRALLSTVITGPSPFELVSLLILPNFFFYMGFWNFCLSVPILFLAIAYFRRQSRRRNPVSPLVLLLLSVLTYAAHLASWGVLVLVVSLDRGADIVRSWGTGELQRTLRRSAVDLAALIVPAIFVFVHLGSAASGLEFGGTFRERAWPLYSASFLRGLNPSDRWLSAAFVVLIGSLALLAVADIGRRCKLRGVGTFLLFAVACGVISVWGPGGALSGAYVRERLAFYAWCFATIWLASIPWTLRVRALVATALLALVIAGTVLDLPLERTWSRQLEEYATTRRFIASGSTILPIQMETQFPAIDPMLHAGDLVALEGAIDLRNYEAALSYFSVQFRPDRSPVHHLVEPTEMDCAEPEFDIVRYETATRRAVDYVLIYGGKGTPESLRYANQLTRYRSVYVSPSGRVRLYERRGRQAKM